MPIINSGPAIHVFHTYKYSISSQNGKQGVILWILLSTGISKLQVLGAWLLSYPGATNLLERRRSYSWWFWWLWWKSARKQLTKLISRRDFFSFLILLKTFFLGGGAGKWKAFWRSCTSFKDPQWRSGTFLPIRNGRTTKLHLSLWMHGGWGNLITIAWLLSWSGTFPNHSEGGYPHSSPF